MSGTTVVSGGRQGYMAPSEVATAQQTAAHMNALLMAQVIDGRTVVQRCNAPSGFGAPAARMTFLLNKLMTRVPKTGPDFALLFCSPRCSTSLLYLVHDSGLLSLS